MIGYLSGKLQAISAKSVILDVHGVGYRVAIAEKMLSSLPPIGDTIKLYTHFVMNPRDGTVELFGFASPEEHAFFEYSPQYRASDPKALKRYCQNQNSSLYNWRSSKAMKHISIQLPVWAQKQPSG